MPGIPMTPEDWWRGSAIRSFSFRRIGLEVFRHRSSLASSNWRKKIPKRLGSMQPTLRAGIAGER